MLMLSQSLRVTLTVFMFWLQLQSLTYLRKTVGTSVRWPSLGFNKWDTSRKTGKRLVPHTLVCKCAADAIRYFKCDGRDRNIVTGGI